LPELIALYEDHADQRDKFEIIAVHDKSVKSFAELDEKLPKIKERYWQGKDLPFPVLLDATGETGKLYGIAHYPTGLLIDPEGKLVGEVYTAADLEAKLPPVSMAKKWARRRDIHTNGSWSFEPSRNTLNIFADTLKLFSAVEVELDVKAIKECGLTPDGPLPSVVIGGWGVSLRSIDELVLAPHGLGIEPSADGKKLLITKRSAKNEAESYFQKLHGKELSERLDGGPAGANDAKPLEIKDQSLLDAVKRINQEFDLPIALDAKAMHAKTLDLEARVSGKIGPGDLRISLTKMLEPLGLTVVVRDEVVLVTPKNK
jgi:AhpC/TSA family